MSDILKSESLQVLPFLPYAIAVITFVAMKFLNVHPAAVVVSTLAFGALFMR